MPGAVIGNPIPDWLKPENASVLDSPVTKAIRTLAHLIGADDPQSQVLGLMTPLAPEGQAMASKPVQKALKTLADLGERVGIKAYHGSPHDFDQFSLSKIGTGEGAQVYGHGLYFAEKPGVAAYYKQAGIVDPREAMTQIIDSARTYKGDDMQLRSLVKSGLYRNRELSKFGDSDEIVNDLVQVIRGHEDGGTISPSAMRALQRIDRAMGELPKGRMYEVRINADPEQLLDWDKPLSEQPRISQLLRDKAPFETQAVPMTGRDVIDAAASYSGTSGLSADANPAKGSQLLREIGIPGIKYLDGGSRAAGEGSRNFVIFDDSLVSILKKYGVALPVIEGLRRKANAQGGTLRAEDVQAVF